MLLDYLKLTTKIWILNLKKPIIFICLTQYTYLFTLIENKRQSETKEEDDILSYMTATVVSVR